MAYFRQYSVDDLQLQLKKSHQRHRDERRFAHDLYHSMIIDELGRLDRWDIVHLEKRRDDLARLGYDADAIIADIQAGRDPLTAEQDRERVRELLTSEFLALVHIACMHRLEKHEHPARCERRREIMLKVGALRVRRAVERVIERKEMFWKVEQHISKLSRSDEMRMHGYFTRASDDGYALEYNFIIPFPLATKENND